ncbi:S41 family peptidase [Dyadobacter psychrotolerans]|uniref:Tail specific protease domain-containing protein n=1 Tax=Dyadobacter psychrotolerans TaxID=2541721 RepID=A0A4R5DSR1_9BACT|nr:S41 family peptidase [Dyadobacter psychrotolerans]TDE15394.1 hypothetical protein E0F88_12840 [Dyadobacter psychrotolerans]
MKKLLAIAFVSVFIAGIFSFYDIGHKLTYWKGTIHAPGQEQEMILVLDKNLFGSVKSKITFPGNLLNHKVNRCNLSGDSLTLEIHDAMVASFKAIKKGESFIGNWNQNGRSFPVKLIETNAAPLQQVLVDKMLNHAKANALNRKTVNWDSLDKLHYFTVNKSKPDSGLMIAADKLLKVLNDDHGFLIYNGNALPNPVGHKNGSSKSPAVIDVLVRGKSMAPQMLTENIAYIRIPTMWALKREEIDQKVSELEQAICGLNYTDKTKWIIDFRLNNGGNFRPMLAGMGNLIGDGTCMYFASDDSQKNQEWALKNGSLYVNGVLETERSKICDVQNYHPKIAVLVGKGSSSAAEDVIVALKGRKDTRFFGEATRGQVTINSTITIDENTHFSFITSNLKDRNGVVYTKAIKPDETIAADDNFGDLKNDPKVVAAIRWLNR